ncbi:MAG: glycerol-3-phosphate acyltransferase [Anaerolineae bacterium]
MGLQLVALGLIAYLLGSIPFGVLFARLFAKTDIRTLGSRHTGALNTWRGAGWLPAALTLLGDVGKGAVAVWLAQQYGWSAYAVAVAGALVIAGHCWPVWLRFRGGMGAATGGGVALMTMPPILVVAIVSWGLWSLILRHSPRAISITALLLPVATWLMGYPPATMALALAASAIIFVRHISELTREYQSFWIDSGRTSARLT